MGICLLNLLVSFVHAFTKKRFLNFSNLDTDFSLQCLAATVSPDSNYLGVFAADCNDKIANSILCSLDYKAKSISSLIDGNTFISNLLTILTLGDLCCVIGAQSSKVQGKCPWVFCQFLGGGCIGCDNYRGRVFLYGNYCTFINNFWNQIGREGLLLSPLTLPLPVNINFKQQ